MTTSAVTPSLSRTLRFRDLVVMGLLLIGALAPVSVFGPIDATSDGAVSLVYVVACAAMAFTAASYARMAAAVPRAGSVFAYAGAGLGPHFGFIAGWMILLDYLLVPGLCFLVTGIALNSFIPSVPVWVFTVAALIITTGLNLLGARLASNAGTAIIIAEAVLLVIIVVAVVVFLSVQGPTRGWMTPFTGETFSMGGVLQAVSVAVLSFLGFDAIATFAEENTGKPDVVGKATITCLVIVGVLFVLETYLGALINPVSAQQLVADPSLQESTFYTAVNASIGEWLSTVLAVVKAVGASFAAMVGVAASSRLIFGMARDRRLPPVLAAVSPKRGTPIVATVVSAVLTMLIAVPASLFSEGLSVLSSLINVGALTAFLLLHASVVGYTIKIGSRGKPIRDFVIPILGGVIIVAIMVSAASTAQWLGAAWLVIGIVVLLFQRKRPMDLSALSEVKNSDNAMNA